MQNSNYLVIPKHTTMNREGRNARRKKRINGVIINGWWVRHYKPMNREREREKFGTDGEPVIK